MSFSWQNLRDDLVAYRTVITHRLGYVTLPLGLIVLSLPTMMRPSTANMPAAASLIILGCVLIGLAVTFLTHPSIMCEPIWYRYDVEIKTETAKLRQFLESSGMKWSSKNYPNPETLNNLTIDTRIFVTRLEDRMLLRMRF